MKNILVAEDISSEGEVLQRILPGMFLRAFNRTIKVDVATTSRKMFEALHSESYDVLILDLVMPDSGMENTIEIVIPALFPGPPVFVLTGYSQPEIRTRCFLKGADDFMLKQAARRHHEEMCERVWSCYLRRLRDGQRA